MPPWDWRTVKLLLDRVKEKYEEEEAEELKEIEPEYFEDDKPLVLVFREKPRRRWYFRAKPITAYRPTLGQALTRIVFGEIAKMAKGEKMTGDMPPAAELVRKYMKGLKFVRKKKVKKWEKIVALWNQRRVWWANQSISHRYVARQRGGISSSGTPKILQRV